jgi:hypothetical protein
MAVLSMSKQEFNRLDVLVRVQSGRLRVADACALIGHEPAVHVRVSGDDRIEILRGHLGNMKAPHPPAALDQGRHSLFRRDWTIGAIRSLPPDEGFISFDRRSAPA